MVQHVPMVHSKTHMNKNTLIAKKTLKIGKLCSGPCPIGHAQSIALGLSSDTDEQRIGRRSHWVGVTKCDRLPGVVSQQK